MACFEIGYIEQYCEKYHETGEGDLYETVIRERGDCWEACPILNNFGYDCKNASDRIKYKGFNLKKYDIHKSENPYEMDDLLRLETNKRIYDCFYLKMDDQVLIDQRDDYKEDEVNGC